MAIQKDGFATLVDIAGATLYEKGVQTPGLDGGGAIETTTMRNTTYRTKAPKSLIDVTDISFRAAFDAIALTTLIASINVNQEITLTFPDTSTLVVWGWLDKFTPDESVEGEQPEAQCTIVVSNVNGSDVETAPAYTAPA